MSRRSVGAACARALLTALLSASLGGCTLIDDYVSGTPFTLDQPQGEVTVEGQISWSPVLTASEGCSPGGTLFWGRARNTGDVDVVDVTITLDVYDAAGAHIGAFSGSVFNGTVTIDGDVDAFGTDLVVDQLGTFNVCTTVPFGAAARVEYTTQFVVIDTGGA